MPDTTTYRYDAFISYRHVEPDRKWAKWLHKALETFKTPKPLVAKGIAPRIKRVFRDEDELPASADLSKEIDNALEQSRFLIVVCSPRTPQSEWVNQEVVRFREMGRHDKILALLIEGEPAESFPRALREIRTEVTDEHGRVSEHIEDVEPLAADVREGRGEAGGFLKRMALLRFSAALLGCRFDDLRGREAERRTRWVLSLSTGVLALAGAMAALTALALVESRRADTRAQQSQQRFLNSLVEQGRTELAARRPPRAAPYLAAAYAQGRDDSVLRFLLAQALRPLDALILAVPSGGSSSFGPNGVQAVTVDQTNALLWDVRDGSRLLTLEGHSRQIKSAVFSFDGTRILTVSADRTARLWDAQSGKTLRTLAEHGGEITSAAFSLDGSRATTEVKVNSGTSVVRLWDLRSGDLLATIPANGERSVFSPDGTKFVTSDGRSARLWDAETGKALVTLGGHTDRIRSAVFTPDGTRVATGSFGGIWRLWDVRTGRSLATFEGQDGLVSVDAVSPDGTRVVTSANGTLRLWDVEERRVLAAVRVGVPAVAAFNSDGTMLLTTASDTTARLWDATTGMARVALQGHTSGLLSASFSPEGTEAITAGYDGTVRMWDTRSGALVSTLEGYRAEFSFDGTKVLTETDHAVCVWDVRRTSTTLAEGAGVASAVFSPDGTKVVWQCGGVWQLLDRKSQRILRTTGREDMSSISRSLFSPDGTTIVMAGDDGIARLWDVQDGSELGALVGRSGSIWDAAFGPDGTRIVTASGRDGPARLWDVRSRTQFLALGERSIGASAVEFSPDGTRVVTSGQRTGLWDANDGSALAVVKGRISKSGPGPFSHDGAMLVTVDNEVDHHSLHLWDGRSGRPLLSLKERSPITSAVLSPNGKQVLTTGLRTARLWDTSSGKALVEFMGHSAAVNCAAFSPDGAMVVTGSDDRTVRLWDARHGRVLATLRGHTFFVGEVTFSPDGSSIRSAGYDGTVRLWDVSLETRSPAEINKLLREKCPYALVDGRLVKVTPRQGK